VDLLGAWCSSWVSVVLMIEAPHYLHTHSRSSLYIYKVFQHLLQWLAAIGHKDAATPLYLPLRPEIESGSPWCRRCVSVSSYD
jgi:hypothetical protein